MAEQRENWSSRTGFIIAAVGSAVGLGNIWRFPYVAYDNGGGAFMVPYLIALLTAGIPLLFLDYIIGHKYRAAAPRAYKKLAPSGQFVGWWQTLVSFVIAVYYAAVIVWAGSYMFFSFGQKWGEDTTNFFVSDFVKHTGDLTSVFVPQMFVGLVIVWALAILIMFGGIRKGVELANKICLPLLLVLFGVMVFKAIALPGAVIGLNAFFEPNWARMSDPNVWLAAYGHVFFSLSVGFGIMVTYASYLQKNTNLTGAGLVVGFANSSFELMAGIGIFAAIGFMAMSTGQDVSEVASGGVGLAFFVFPKIISTMGASGDFVGFLFFGSLVVAGISSLISILE
ncbi:MAG: sodium-dependent transporter, partial [Psychrobacter sp.]|nr:sodium-dependent transporter [Psychrobacter sp.]